MKIIKLNTYSIKKKRTLHNQAEFCFLSVCEWIVKQDPQNLFSSSAARSASESAEGFEDPFVKI